MSIGLPQWIVLAVALLRVAELVYSQQNTKRLLAKGGREFGRGHYPLFIVLHSGWLLALFFGVPNSADVEPILLIFFGLLLCGRVWVIATLGPYWTTRVIITQISLIRNGPYRSVRHPNYWVVTAEIAVLPFRRMAMGRRFFGLERRASVVAHSNRKRSFGSARRRRGCAMRTSKIEF